MNKNDFIYDADHKVFTAIINGMEISIDKEDMTDKALSLAERVLSEYPKKFAMITDYLSKDESIIIFYNSVSKEEIGENLGVPIIRIDETGGVLSYCDHKFDHVHIIDLEFGGALEELYGVSIDGWLILGRIFVMMK